MDRTREHSGLEMDDLDIRLLSLLQENSRTSYRQLAREAKSTVPTVSSRVERLVKLGVIRRFGLELDLERLGEYVTVLLMLEVDPPRREEVARKLAEDPRFVDIYLTTDSGTAVVARGVVSPHEVPDLGSGLGVEGIRNYRVLLAREMKREVRLPLLGAAVRLHCAYCNKVIVGRAIRRKVEGRDYFLCCPGCEAAFSGRLERMGKRRRSGGG